MLIKIYANDGKEFKGESYNVLVSELNAYETEQRKKKEKEEAERKTREEKQKKLSQLREKSLKEIDDATQKLNDLIDTYEKLSGRKVVYIYDYELKKYVATDTRNTIDFAFDDIYSEFLKALRKK